MLFLSVSAALYWTFVYPISGVAKRFKRSSTAFLPISCDGCSRVVMLIPLPSKIGTGLRAIMLKSSGMGVATQTGKPEWNRATIKDILQNNLYTGMIRWNRRKTSKEYDDGKVKRKKRRLTPDDYLVVPGKHPAIISQEIFDEAQTLWSGNVPVKANTTIINPFARLMFCKHCRKAISYVSYAHKKGKVQPRMVNRESELCKVKSAPYNDVLNLVIQGLKMQIADFDFKLSNAESQNALQQHQQIVESLKKELQTQKSKRMQLFEYLESGIYTKQEFMERKAILADRIEKLKTNIESEEKKIPTDVDYQEVIYKFTEVVDALSDPEVPAKRKNDLLKGIIKKIEYDCEDLGKGKGGNVSLDIHFKDQYQVPQGNGRSRKPPDGF